MSICFTVRSTIFVSVMKDLKVIRIKEFPILLRHIEKAKERERSMGIINNSFLLGKGTLKGFIAEEVVAEVLGADFSGGSKNCDMTLAGKKLEIKAVGCTSAPKDFYNCHVAETSWHQKCDYYIFARVMEDLSKLWIVGKIKHADFHKLAGKNKKGKVDPNSITEEDYQFKANCRSITIAELSPIKYSVSLLKKFNTK